MKEKLSQLGYSAGAVKKMDASEAHFILSNMVKFQPKKPAHIKHVLEDSSDPIILGPLKDTKKE